jgi:hypothetical protein
MVLRGREHLKRAGGWDIFSDLSMRQEVRRRFATNTGPNGADECTGGQVAASFYRIANADDQPTGQETP